MKAMRRTFIVTLLLTVLAGCRSPGLPPEPPEQDAANPEAGAVEARPNRANPFTRSAFEGVKLDGAGGHEHHHHGHGAKKSEAAAKAEEPAKTPEASSHESHGGRS
jgi:predicted small lipoprotein YifL